jgi:hypothetical protein
VQPYRRACCLICRSWYGGHHASLAKCGLLSIIHRLLQPSTLSLHLKGSHATVVAVHLCTSDPLHCTLPGAHTADPWSMFQRQLFHYKTSCRYQDRWSAVSEVATWCCRCTRGDTLSAHVASMLHAVVHEPKHVTELAFHEPCVPWCSSDSKIRTTSNCPVTGMS